MKKTYLIIAGIMLATAAVLSSYFIAPANSTSNNKITEDKNLQSLFVDQTSDASYFLEPQSYSQIPDSTVTIHPATGGSTATKIAILIPQTHRYPGSNISDSVNDSAVIAQGQIYKIISYLEKAGANTVMAEGDLEGKIPDDKIKNLSQKITLKEELKAEVQKIKGSDQGEITPQFYTAVENLISSIDREILLAGAPYKLKAEGYNINLYGTEDQKLLDNSAEIVRNTIYLQDRLSALQGVNTVGFSLSKTSLVNPENNSTLKDKLLELLQNRSLVANTSDIDNELKMNKINAANNSDLNALLDQAQNTYNEIKELDKPQTTNSSAPSRQQNPYNNINDVGTIQNLIKDNNDKLQETVVDQRNQSTAEKFVQLLSAQNKDVAIITFGSEHQEGLIQELNKRGISVVDILPNEVGQKTQ
ncbi:MAG: hypothetical protein WCV92_01295 [Candidatus Buchananbacteria bacterium]